MEKQQIGIQKEIVGGGESCPFEKSKNLEAFPGRGWKGHLLELAEVCWGLGDSSFPSFQEFPLSFPFLCLLAMSHIPVGSLQLTLVALGSNNPGW